jgi:hypothetical protein
MLQSQQHIPVEIKARKGHKRIHGTNWEMHAGMITEIGITRTKPRTQSEHNFENVKRKQKTARARRMETTC